MRFSRGIPLLGFGAFVGFAFVGLAATYWAIAGSRSILLRADNPRLIEALAAIQRGGIYDRAERLLVETVPAEGGLERRYLKPSTYSLVGYYSLRYGVGMAEAAFDDSLAGSSEVETLQDFVSKSLLRQPQIGADIRLTIEADLQDALYAAIGQRQAAAVVMNAESGEILALVSEPSYDPNSLDADWSDLVQAPGKPFFNRALQGNYQLGGFMYTLLLAQAMAADYDIATRSAAADAPIELQDGMIVSCVSAPASADLSLADAYIHGCPAAFRAYWRSAPRQDLEAILAKYSFDEPITLDGFPQPEAVELPPDSAGDRFSGDARQLRALFGQGDETATPLRLAAVMAAIASDGRLKAPVIQAGLRPPDEVRWQAPPRDSAATPIMAEEVARELRLLLQRAWSTLLDEPAAGDREVGAQITKSQSGDERQLWLSGYLAAEHDAPISFVVVLESSDDLSRLAAIGQRLISALDRRL